MPDAAASGVICGFAQQRKLIRNIANNKRVRGGRANMNCLNAHGPYAQYEREHGAPITVDLNGADGELGATSKGDTAIEASVRWHVDSSFTLDATHSLTIAPYAVIANAGTGPTWARSIGREALAFVTALYDVNGRYTSGVVRSDHSWMAAPFSGLVTQVTTYQLVNNLADMNAVSNNLAGNYAIGNRAIDFLDPVNFDTRTIRRDRHATRPRSDARH
ncbi:hypothetical protein [Paraburkholderia youngii]|uniref:hypothetical protein n=1 Tax=Paraburkholderia youngii TaxID=2782701 RepID=UPI003D212031